MSLIPNEQPEDMELSNYKLETPSNKQRLENSYFARAFLLFMTILGTTMVIGDGIFTPPMSVISAVNGISAKLSQGISFLFFIFYFSCNYYNTGNVNECPFVTFRLRGWYHYIDTGIPFWCAKVWY